jgi:hypothetical protein
VTPVSVSAAVAETTATLRWPSPTWPIRPAIHGKSLFGSGATSSLPCVTHSSTAGGCANESRIGFTAETRRAPRIVLFATFRTKVTKQEFQAWRIDRCGGYDFKPRSFRLWTQVIGHTGIRLQIDLEKLVSASLVENRTFKKGLPVVYGQGGGLLRPR